MRLAEQRLGSDSSSLGVPSRSTSGLSGSRTDRRSHLPLGPATTRERGGRSCQARRELRDRSPLPDSAPDGAGAAPSQSLSEDSWGLAEDSHATEIRRASSEN